TLRRQSLRRNIGQPRTLLPLSRSWFKGTLLEAHWPYRRGQVTSSVFRNVENRCEAVEVVREKKSKWV
ncbi:hypothetical protein, partial [Burkholderia mallei]